MYWKLPKILRRQNHWFQCLSYLISMPSANWHLFLELLCMNDRKKMSATKNRLFQRQQNCPSGKYFGSASWSNFCSRSNLVFALLPKIHEGWLALASFSGTLHHQHHTFKSIQPTNVYSQRENSKENKD